VQKTIAGQCHPHCSAATSSTPIYVKQSLIPGAGGGLFAGQPFKKGDTISIYAGSRVPAACLSNTAIARGYVIRARGYIDTYNESGRLQLSSGEVVNTNNFSAKQWASLKSVGVAWVGRSSLARYANHSNASNARMKGLRILAKRDVLAGEEVTVSYGPGYKALYK
jgi:hypothetical protein